MKSNFSFCFLLLFVSCSSFLYAQETVIIEQDTIKANKKNKKIHLDPLAPSKAAFYSAILPGLGQAYNKSYWKIPIVYGAMGTSIYFYVDNNNEYNRYRDAYKRRLAGFRDDEFFDQETQTEIISNQGLIDAQEFFRRNRDLSMLITVGLYVLNIIDANVDAHLKQFNVGEDLTLTIDPYFKQNPNNNNTNAGLRLRFNFD
ncbi:DUF5683 domain-containing protein [Sungkyunkwania multivorans]|uniref:DUF5683 domain-containing protein n=1 Tax=Sungkyunkwania multivorans TaxID=1173618 RepID=A0ABW3CUA4_9FLAO